MGRSNAEEDPARCAQVSALRFREAEVEAATPLAEAAARQQLELEAELRYAEEFAEHRSAKAGKAASVSADDLRQDNFDDATVAPLLRWLTSHSAAWAMGRMATAVVSSEKSRAARASSENEQLRAAGRAHRGRVSSKTSTATAPTAGEDGR